MIRQFFPVERFPNNSASQGLDGDIRWDRLSSSSYQHQYNHHMIITIIIIFIHHQMLSSWMLPNNTVWARWVGVWGNHCDHSDHCDQCYHSDHCDHCYHSDYYIGNNCIQSLRNRIVCYFLSLQFLQKECKQNSMN